MLKFNFKVIRLMWSRSGGVGFTEDVSEFMVVWWNTSHVNQSMIRGGLVRKEELVDLVIIHFREMGESCCVDEGNFWSNEWSRSWRVR